MAGAPEDYAVQEPIRDEEPREISLGPDALSAALRSDLRDRIERIIREELYAALGAGPYERTPERRGYLHSPRERTLTTAEGTATITVPRGRLFRPEGGSEEWQSQLLPRYARRTREVDAALIGLYLSGTNTRRVKLALKPLLKGAPLSKSAVSRVVTGLQEQYETWRRCTLSGEVLKVLYLDAVWLRVRLAKKIEKLPVAVAIGVRAGGTKVLLGLWVYASEGRGMGRRARGSQCTRPAGSGAGGDRRQQGAARHQHRRARHRGVPPAGQDAGGAALRGQCAALAVRSGGVGAVAVPEARRLPGARSGRPSGRVTMTPVSSDLEIVAVRASME